MEPKVNSDIMTILLFTHTQRYHWNVLPGIIVLCSAAEAVDELRHRLNDLTKSRLVDAEWKKLIENDEVFTCEKHFTGEDIEIC